MIVGSVILTIVVNLVLRVIWAGRVPSELAMTTAAQPGVWERRADARYRADFEVAGAVENRDVTAVRMHLPRSWCC